MLPPLTKILRHLDKHQPDVIHISTPGPMGLIGYIAARMLRVPVLGVYHTDFPAYIDQLFDDHAMTWNVPVHDVVLPTVQGDLHVLDRLRGSARFAGFAGQRMTVLVPGVDTGL